MIRSSASVKVPDCLGGTGCPSSDLRRFSQQKVTNSLVARRRRRVASRKGCFLSELAKVAVVELRSDPELIGYAGGQVEPEVRKGGAALNGVHGQPIIGVRVDKSLRCEPVYFHVAVKEYYGNKQAARFGRRDVGAARLLGDDELEIVVGA